MTNPKKPHPSQAPQPPHPPHVPRPGAPRRRKRKGSSAPPVAAPIPPAPATPSPDTTPSPSVAGGEVDVAARMLELEERLDRMMAERVRDGEEGRPSPAGNAVRATPPPHPAPSDEGVLDQARELLSADFYLRKWGRIGLRNRSQDVDDFGYDPVYERKILPLFEFLYEKYFRVEVTGLQNVPAEGRCLLVANHSGTIPFDGIMLRLAVRREHPRHRDVRWLAEDVIFHFPFLGSFTSRVGAVRACQENGERLLRQDALAAVFPEGMKGIGKLFKDRYKLQRFGRGGFIKLCLRTRTPIVPVAIIGGEETNPMLARIEYLTRAVGIPYLPVTPTFPALGPLGLLPAPTKWKLYFEPPVHLDGYGTESAEDEILVGRLTESIRSTIQSRLDRALFERRSVWFG
jgi:1-acyl-sn-glycerol-3-phosphate acyltransferase